MRQLCQLRDDLDSRRAIANHCDGLLRQVHIKLPVRRMTLEAGKLVESFDRRPVPFSVFPTQQSLCLHQRRKDHNDVRQYPLTRYQNIGIFHRHLICVLDSDLPFTIIPLPFRIDDAVLEPDIAVEVPFLGGGCDVLLDLGPRCIEVVPVRFGIKWKSLI